MELDLAWAVKGGQDPVELFKQNPGRFPLWHVKDLDSTREIIEPVGSGTIDFKRIFAASETAGLNYYFIEHDLPKDPWDSIQKSYTVLKRWRLYSEKYFIFSMRGLQTILFLFISNTFMTFAWYGHLRFKDFTWGKNMGLFTVILISWGLAFFEYLFQVPIAWALKETVVLILWFS